MAGKMTFRFAQPGDALLFADWAVKNPQTAAKDIKAGMRENNPTATVLVVEEDGVPVMFMPVYLTMRIAYLGFNPDNNRHTTLEAMETMLMAVRGLAGAYQINEIDTLTKAGIPVAEWARSKGFDADDRELFTLKNGLEASIN